MGGTRFCLRTASGVSGGGEPGKAPRQRGQHAGGAKVLRGRDIATACRARHVPYPPRKGADPVSPVSLPSHAQALANATAASNGKQQMGTRSSPPVDLRWRFAGSVGNLLHRGPRFGLKWLGGRRALHLRRRPSTRGRTSPRAQMVSFPRRHPTGAANTARRWPAVRGQLQWAGGATRHGVPRSWVR